MSPSRKRFFHLRTTIRTNLTNEVQITPLGSYDVGRTVAGGQDPRLGKIDVVLLSHFHGDRHISRVNSGECGKPNISENATPSSNTFL